MTVRRPLGPRLGPDAPVERAVRWIIEEGGATYAEAAAKFDVKANSIRSRVEHRYGSLAQARLDGGGGAVPETYTRQCIVCRRVFEMERYQHICDGCKANML